MMEWEAWNAHFFRIGDMIARRFDLVDTTGNLIIRRYQRQDVQGRDVTLWLNRHANERHSYIVNEHFIQARPDGSWWRCERGPVSGFEQAILDSLWDELHRT